MEDSTKVLKDTESETYCVMSAFFDWLIVTFDEMAIFKDENTWTQQGQTHFFLVKTLRIVNDWNAPPKLSYKLSNNRLNDFILVGDDLYQNLKKVAFHFFIDFVEVFNSKSPYFTLQSDNFQFFKEPGVIRVLFYVYLRQGLLLKDVYQKIKDEKLLN